MAPRRPQRAPVRAQVRLLPLPALLGSAERDGRHATCSGNSSLEGLLASKGVNLAFSGHAHIYERNNAAAGAGACRACPAT